jgi:LruC domain-containing protein
MKTFKHYFLVSLLVIFTSCQQNDLEADDPSGSLENQEGYSLSIPDGFNFATERKVRLNITDATPYVRYQVFGYSSTIGSEAENISDAFNNLLYTGEPYNGSANFELSISNMYDKVYVSRNDGGESTFEITDISNNRIDISYSSVNSPSTNTKGNRRGAPAELYYPGGTNEANIVFEDLWPSQGDYDFNDLVISYRIVFHLNIDGNVDSMDYIYDVTNVGAAYRNGFGIEFPWDAALYGVTGQRDGAPQPENTANGSTIFFFGDANLYLNAPQTLTITFTTAQDASIVSAPPYNPFLTANGDTNYEVHLAGELYAGTTQPITFPGFAPSFAQANNDVNADYTVDAGVELNVPPLTDMEGMPWAINIAGEYVPPLPGEFIMKGHLKFLEWAQSGGVNFPDWFMDVSGYRDFNYLEAPPIAPPLPATIGDLRAGGVVFWVDPEDVTHGLVCAMSDYFSTTDWGCWDTDLPNVANVPYNLGNPVGIGAEIGFGMTNTNGILTDCPTAGAAFAARSYGPEWFLPSAKELNEMYVHKATLDTAAGFTPFIGVYWSSTEGNSEIAWVQHFGAGIQYNDDKDGANKNVRAVRAF